MDDFASAAGDAAEGEGAASGAGDGLVTTCVGTTPSAATATTSSAPTTEIAAGGREAAPSGGGAGCSSGVRAGIGDAGGGCDGGFKFCSFSVVG